MKKTIEVVAAIIKQDDLIFCAKRNHKGEAKHKWEFPGGKIEINETKEEALIREIKEELDIIIRVDKYFMTVEESYHDFNLIMHAFISEVLIGEIKLNEHVDSCWLHINKLSNLNWAKADIPIVEKLMEEV